MKEKISLLGLAILLVVTLVQCTKEPTVTAPSKIIPEENRETKKENDLSGQWTITKVTGGPITIFPAGKNQKGIPLNINSVYENGSFEFLNGIGFLKIPNTPQEQIGGYTINGNTLIFDNTEGEKQNMRFHRDGNALELYFSPEDYKKIISGKSDGKVEMEISSEIVFHLKK